MKKYIDWIVEGVVLSAMVIAFLFVVGKNRSSSIVFEGEVGTMIFFIAVFSCIMAIFLLHMKKRDNRFVRSRLVAVPSISVSSMRMCLVPIRLTEPY